LQHILELIVADEGEEGSIDALRIGVVGRVVVSNYSSKRLWRLASSYKSQFEYMGDSERVYVRSKFGSLVIFSIFPVLGACISGGELKMRKQR
jgi:hypothetical protein